MLVTHSFFCLGLLGHNNVGLKTRACQSSNGRVLSLNRQATIGPHPAPQIHPKSSLSYKNKFTFPALVSVEKEFTSHITSMCYSNDRGLLAIKFDQKILFLVFFSPSNTRCSSHCTCHYFSKDTGQLKQFAEPG